MSAWIAVGVLALVAFAAIAFVLRAPRRTWEAAAAALVLGLGGYAWQGEPDLPSAPKAPAESFSDGTALVTSRQALNAEAGAPSSSWQVIADAMVRRGQYGNAAEVLRGAVRQNPADVQAWLAMANALVGHADGVLTPAALTAYQRAAAAAPDHPGPPFFLGLALAQNGKLAEGREVWAKLLARTPADAPWRDDLTQRIAALDQFIAQQRNAPAVAAP